MNIFCILISLLITLGIIPNDKNTSAKITDHILPRVGQKHVVDADFFVMKKIIINSLKHGPHEVLVDDKDYDLVKRYNWVLKKTPYKKYAQTNIPIKNSKFRQTTISMHRLLTNFPIGMEIDHKNGNGLDNRRCNIRAGSKSKNQMNRGKQINNSAGYKGVFYKTNQKKYAVKIGVNKVRIFGGYYKDPRQAAYQYNILAKKYHGDYAVLNVLSKEDIHWVLQNPKQSKYSDNTTGYRGVSPQIGNGNKGFRAIIYVDGKNKFLGSFYTAKEAAIAYNNAVIKYKKDIRFLNKI